MLECFPDKNIRGQIYRVWQNLTCQLLNATELKLGLLVNFGHYPKLEYERLILTRDKINESLVFFVYFVGRYAK